MKLHDVADPLEKQKIGIPNLFRILIIDDQICSDLECKSKTGQEAKRVQAAISNYLKYALEGVGATAKIEVEFAKDPDEGVSLWRSQIFDLTLVDSDFSKGESSKRRNHEKRNFLDLNLEFAGAYLYCFLREMSQKDESRKGCEIALWTGLGLGSGKEKRAGDLLSILPSKQQDDFRPTLFIPKKESDVAAWNGVVAASSREKEIRVESVEEALGKMVMTNPVLNPSIVTPEVIVARVKSLYCIKPPEEFARLCGIKNRVYTGWLTEDGSGNICLSDIWAAGAKLLSPVLRRGEDNDDADMQNSDDAESSRPRKEKLAKREVEKDFFSKTLLEIREDESGIIVPMPDSKWRNDPRIIAAATPLTGCSATGRDYSIKLMVKKMAALLDGSFGRVVLKTVYLDSLSQWKDKVWPELQAQESHRTRCLRSTRHTRTLWNTGQTSMEAFTPEMMHEFLTQMPDSYRKRIIVSLGSKFPQAALKNSRQGNCLNKMFGIWEQLFKSVFDGLNNGDYPVVEINVRHYLRECIKANLGGHEYLSPAQISESFTGGYDAVDKEFKKWLCVLNFVAGKYGKRLLLKLPFRGDLLHFISLICKFSERDKANIAGITLINAFKSAAGETEYGTPYSPASYGEPIKDRRWGYQMSGEMLTASRNELMGEVAALAAAMKDKNFEIHISGGIVDKTGMDFCLDCAGRNNPNVSVQVGTWALMDLNLSKQDWSECQGDAPSVGSGHPVIDGCVGKCNPCRVTCCPSGAFNRGGNSQPAWIDHTKCTACQKCIRQCICKRIRFNVVETSIESGENGGLDAQTNELPRRLAFCLHELCNGCGKCSRTFYCDTFMDRRGFDLPPIMDVRNCTGCGLCAQTCPRGAIQLFDIKHVAVLIGDCKDHLRRWHQYLFENEIPHLVFDSSKQLDAIGESFLNKAKVVVARDGEFSLEGLEEIKDEVDRRLKYLREEK